MKPKKTETPQGELFRNRLENIINMDHELVRVAEQIDWAGLEEKFGRCYVENVGRPGCPTRLMVGLHYLKYAFNQSDEGALATAGQIFRQERHDRNKTYSVHAPEVECIAKGKAHKKYEFGCKTSFVSTSRGNWIVGALAIHGNPYDGHTLEAAVTQTVGLTGRTPSDIYCDRGYRGAKIETDGDCRVHLAGKKSKGLTRAEKKWLKRRSAIEPVIGHLKQDHRLDRNHLPGENGDRMNAIFAAAGFNLRKLLRFFLRPGGTWQKSSGLLLYLCPFETGDPRNRENRIKITPSIYHHHCLAAG
jgi:hypothetical protein